MLSFRLLLKNLFYGRLFRKAGVYTLGNVLHALVPFLLMPVLTRYLTPEDYGITSMFGVLTSIYTPFIGLNLHGFVNVSYFKTGIDFPVLVSSCFHVLTISTLLAGIVTWLGADAISALTHFPSDWLWTVPVICYCNFFVSVLQVIQQAEGRAKQYVTVQMAHVILQCVLSLVFVVLLGWDWQGRILAQVISVVLFLWIAFFLLRSWGLLRYKYERKYVQDGLRFGLPLLPHTLCNFFIISSDRLFLTNMVGMAEVGIFSVGYSLGMAINLIGTAFNRAFMPWLFEKLKNADEDRESQHKQIVRVSYLCMGGFLCLAILYSFFMPWGLSLFLGSRFQAASRYIFAFSVGAAFQAMYYIVANFVFYSTRTNYLAIVTFGNGVAHIAITYGMISKWGTMGAAWATAITHAAIFFCTWFLSHRVYPMPWLFWRVRRCE